MKTSEFRWAEVRVGLFVALFGIVLFAGVVYVGLAGTPFAQRAKLVAWFDDASGLAIGSPVEMGGVVVGEIADIELPDVRTGKVKVVLGVRDEALERTGPSSVAYVDSHAFVGQRYVGLTPRRPEELHFTDGATIATRPSSDLSTILDDARELLDEMKGLVADTRSAIEPVRRAAEAIASAEGTVGKLLHDDSIYRRLDESTAALEKTARALADGRGALGILLNDEAFARRLVGGIDAFSQTARRINEGQGALGRLVSDDATAKRVEATLANLEQVSRNLADAQGTLGALISDKALLQRLNALMGEMDSLLADLRKNPSRYLKLQPF